MVSINAESTLSLTHGRPTYRFADYDHTPYNKRRGEVFQSSVTLEVADLDALDQSFTHLNLTEQTTANAGGRMSGRTITVTLNAMERAKLIAFLTREPFAKVVEYHTERAEYETEEEARAAIAVAVDLGVLPNMDAGRVDRSFNHSAGCWRFPVAVWNDRRNKDFWLVAWKAGLVGR